MQGLMTWGDPTAVRLDRCRGVRNQWFCRPRSTGCDMEGHRKKGPMAAAPVTPRNLTSRSGQTYDCYNSIDRAAQGKVALTRDIPQDRSNETGTTRRQQSELAPQPAVMPQNSLAHPRRAPVAEPIRQLRIRQPRLTPCPHHCGIPGRLQRRFRWPITRGQPPRQLHRILARQLLPLKLLQLGDQLPKGDRLRRLRITGSHARSILLQQVRHIFAGNHRAPV